MQDKQKEPSKKNTMKKVIMMVVAALFATTMNAQREVGSVTIQPRVGFNLANLTDGGDMRLGFAGGAEVEYQATDMFSQQSLCSQPPSGGTTPGVTLPNEVWKAYVRTSLVSLGGYCLIT